VLVLVSGMFRSGSTYSFNVVREALRKRGTLEIGSGASADVMRGSRSQHFVNKVHYEMGGLVDMLGSGEAISVCTIRTRPEEAVASLVATFDFDLKTAIVWMTNWFRLYERIASKSLIIELSELESHPVHSALLIGQYVAPNYTKSEAVETARHYSKRVVRRIGQSIETGELRSIDLGFSKYDPETYFHRRHVSVRANQLDATLVRESRLAFAEWTDEQGRLLLRSNALRLAS
jgi:hypothetical protein